MRFSIIQSTKGKKSLRDEENVPRKDSSGAFLRLNVTRNLGK
jgi:hypothetical protein